MAGAVSFRIEGLADMERRAIAVSRQLAARMKAALEGEAFAIIQDSIDNYVPRDTGALAESAFVDEARRTRADVFTVQFGYGKRGSPAAAYALAVHEHPSKYSPPSWKNVRDPKTGRFRAVRFNGGGPKYLERPLQAAGAGMDIRIAEKVKI